MGYQIRPSKSIFRSSHGEIILLKYHQRLFKISFIFLAPGYMGCFVDKGHPPTLSGMFVKHAGKDNTVASCLEFCRGQGYKYAGVESGVYHLISAASDYIKSADTAPF